MNEQNLRPLSQSHEEAVRNGRKGGIASGEARRERAKLRELLEVALDEPYVDAIDGKTDMTNAEKICIALVEKAIAGDTKAFALIRDTIGEQPTQVLAVEQGPSREAIEEMNRLLGLSDEEFEREMTERKAG